MDLKKELSGVAEVAAQIMGEQLKGQQHQIDKNKNNKIDAHDFAILRGEKKAVKKEEVEQIEELSKDTLKSYVGKVVDKTRTMPQGAKKQKHLTGLGKAMDKMKEEVEQEEENFMTFSEMIAAYKEYGLAVIAEEPTEEEFNDEIKKAQAKSEGKEKADVAKASVQAVKQEEIEVLDADVINGVEEVTIDERSMTKPEMKKREDIVKGMKKKMSGFKERYGERAKNVMYATATKQAMKY